MSGVFGDVPLHPLQGQLIPLKTKHEVQASVNDTVEAFVVAIPKRLASKATAIVKPLQSPLQPTQPSFQHLRRFANAAHLPEQLRLDFEASINASTQSHDVVYFLIPPPLPPESTIVTAFREHLGSTFPLVIRDLQIPANAPVSQEQADRNTKYYWPCSYNPAAQIIQHAPPYQTLRIITNEITSGVWHVGHYMQLAHVAAENAFNAGIGRPCGAVAVESSSGRVVAIAGDGRWRGGGNDEKNGEGRPEQHALMRLIAMVAARERHGRGILDVEPRSGMDDVVAPLTPLEKRFLETGISVTIDGYSPTSKTPAVDEEMGYLCANLDVYLTHEPCVMCSMAMIHSRFRVCVFTHRMPGTGGLCAETVDGGIGYGLPWRKELNWRTVTFQFQSQENTGDYSGLFHA